VQPCRKRTDLVSPHVQVSAGQDFEIEWSTGHPNSYFFFTVIAAGDEDKLALVTEELLYDYVSKSPAGVDCTFGERDKRTTDGSVLGMFRCVENATAGDGYLDDDLHDRMHLGWAHKKGNGQPNDGAKYARAIPPGDRRYIPRATEFADSRDAEDITLYEYEPQELARDVRVAYESDAYPWILAVHIFPNNL
jgi:hypothetical protein